MNEPSLDRTVVVAEQEGALVGDQVQVSVGGSEQVVAGCGLSFTPAAVGDGPVVVSGHRPQIGGAGLARWPAPIHRQIRLGVIQVHGGGARVFERGRDLGDRHGCQVRIQQLRQRALASRLEQPFGGELRLERLELEREIAETARLQ